MMMHMFDTEIATKYGVNAAVIFQNIAFWCEHERSNLTNYHDGLYWTYNSVKAYQELFPYLGKSQISSALQKLVDEGLIVKGNYNKLAYDRTGWYAVTALGETMFRKSAIACSENQTMEISKIGNGDTENRKPIPDITPDIRNTPYKNTMYSHTSYSPSTHRKRDNWTPQRFDDFWSIYPRHVNKTTAMRAWGKLKADDSLTDTILKDIKRRLDSEWKDADIQFIPHPSTYLNQRRWEDESPSEKPAQIRPKYTRPRGEYGPSDGDYWNGMDRGQYYAAKTIGHLDDGTEIWVFPDGRKYNTVTREFYFDD